MSTNNYQSPSPHPSPSLPPPVPQSFPSLQLPPHFAVTKPPSRVGQPAATHRNFQHSSAGGANQNSAAGKGKGNRVVKELTQSQKNKIKAWGETYVS